MSDDLVKVDSSLSCFEEVELPLTVGMVGTCLQAAFPEEDGEDWDYYGMLVGDKDAKVEKIAIALDATLSNVQRAAHAGAQVLVTHHPAFLSLDLPYTVGPASQVSDESAIIWEAMQNGVAVMSFHTALDAQPCATAILPDMLSLESERVLCPSRINAEKGYGRVCHLRDGDALTLGTLASRCMAVFGRVPRVWGDFSEPLSTVATWAGSLPSVDELGDLSGIDAIVCGEVKYHNALHLARAGIGVYGLGHDVSELPYALLIAQTLQSAGIGHDSLVLLDRGAHWTSPEAIRV